MSHFEATFNLVEAGLWFVVALAFAVKTVFAAARVRSTFALLGLAFLVFAISDLIEARTGKWWDPPWLLVMKASCVVSFLVGFWRYRQLKRHKRDAKQATEPAAK